MNNRLAIVRKVALWALLALGLVYLVTAWVFSGILERDLLVPDTSDPVYDIEVVAVDEATIVVARSEATDRDGIFGVESAASYGQAGTITEIGGEVVERSFRAIDGSLQPGDMVRFDQYAYSGDPETAHGINFEDVRVPGELGAYPAWLIDGARDTWVVIVHGRGVDERKQALRILPALVRAEYPVLVVSYRNDEGAPPAPDGRYGWGLEEWQDLDAALRFGRSRDAEEFVLFGFSMGAEIISMLLHESDLVGEVSGVVFDSPVLDLEEVVDFEADDRGVPGLVTEAAKLIADLRFDVGWDELDQLARAAEFDVPILLMHGSEDDTVPVALSDEFAEARADIVRYERFDGAGHVALWNSNPSRYETAVTAFVDRIAMPLE